MALQFNIPTLVSQTITNGVTAYAPSEDAVFNALALKQDTLVSGINIKTVGGTSLLGIGNIPVGTGDALVANPLSQFAATTSAQLAGLISDETGSGALMFGTSPTITTNYTVSQTTATTNATVTLATYIANSSGTATSNFGIKQVYQAETSTTDNTDLGSEEWYWYDATHAGRRAGWKLNLRSNTGETMSTPLELSLNGNGHELILRNQTGYSPRMSWHVGAVNAFNISASTTDTYISHGNNGHIYIRGGSWATPATFSSNGLYIGGLTAPSAALHVVKSTEQARFGYSASIYESLTVAGTTGIVTRAITGGTTPFFKFSNCVSINTSTTNAGLTVKEFSSGGGNILDVLDYSDNVLLSVSENYIDFLANGGFANMGGSLAFISAPAGIELTANTNNLDIGAVSAVLIYCTSPYDLTGIVSVANGIAEGAVLFVTNLGGTSTITLKHNTASTAANRFVFSAGADVTLAVNETILLYWVNGRWRDVK